MLITEAHHKPQEALRFGSLRSQKATWNHSKTSRRSEYVYLLEEKGDREHTDIQIPEFLVGKKAASMSPERSTTNSNILFLSLGAVLLHERIIFFLIWHPTNKYGVQVSPQKCLLFSRGVPGILVYKATLLNRRKIMANAKQEKLQNFIFLNKIQST